MVLLIICLVGGVLWWWGLTYVREGTRTVQAVMIVQDLCFFARFLFQVSMGPMLVHWKAALPLWRPCSVLCTSR
jgi:hypothetical protein